MQASPDLWLFFALVFGIIVLPGMDMAFVAGSALVAGLRGGAAAVAGIVAAGMLHTLVGATGVAALLVLWPAAFNVLLVAGATYMAWIGWCILGSASSARASAAQATPPRKAAAIFYRAALTCMLNPKAYAFMLAVFPAFLHSAQHTMPVQALRLGAIIAATQLMVYGAVAVFVASARQWSGSSQRGQRWAARTVGAALMGGAMLTLMFAWQPAAATPLASLNRVTMTTSTQDASRDFDFLIGDWRIDNRKLVGLLQGSTQWENFTAQNRVRPMPGRIGNFDEFTAEGWRPGYAGVTLRVFNRTTNQWGLYSLDNRGNGFDAVTGALATPVIGHFDGHEGLFEGPDTLDGRAILVRYRWTRSDADHARWQQFFSADAGKSWELNWVMNMVRAQL